MGSSCMLKLVLMTEGMPVSLWYSVRIAWKPGFDVARHELRPGGAVHVHGRRAGPLHLVGAVERERHELRGVVGAVHVAIARVPMLGERRRRKRHELGAPQPLIEPLVHARLLGVIENRAVAQRARAVLHAAVEARDHLARGNQRRDLRLDRRIPIERQLRPRQGVDDLLVREVRAKKHVRQALHQRAGCRRTRASPRLCRTRRRPCSGARRSPCTPGSSRSR